MYEYLVMPFNLTDAPATFNRMMNWIFSAHWHFTRTFFDDILVFSKNLEEHKRHLDIVFQELRKHQLFINGKKSEFFLKEIHYLSHIISKEGIQMDSTKVMAIKEWPELKTVHEVCSFLGLCSYYRWSIQHFTKYATHLHDLTKKHAIFHWGERQRTSFNHLKEKLIIEPILLLQK